MVPPLADVTTNPKLISTVISTTAPTKSFTVLIFILSNLVHSVLDLLVSLSVHLGLVWSILVYSVHFCPFQSTSVYFSQLLSNSVLFGLFNPILSIRSISFHFVPIRSISVYFCPFGLVLSFRSLWSIRSTLVHCGLLYKTYENIKYF